MRKPRPAHLHASSQTMRRPSRNGVSRNGALAKVVACVLLLAAAGAFVWLWHAGIIGGSNATAPAGAPVQSANSSGSTGTTGSAGSTGSPKFATHTLDRKATPEPDLSAVGKARRLVYAMSMDERVGQLVMAPLFSGTDPSSLASAITDRHVGSVLVLGNWTGGTAVVKSAADQVQGYAPAANRLIAATDQEGGQVQHLTGPGFDMMPSAVDQGAMATDQLRQSAATWGSQLASAGISVDLAPVLGTVMVERASNAPIGALYRDFGLDAAGNAAHGIAFAEGMESAGIGVSVKHYPGLGAVTGNTDFTSDDILDTTTTLDGTQAGAFDQVISQSDPAMVMMALATYQAIDPGNPAAFSPTIIEGHLRGEVGYKGVVISDSLSAEALNGYDTSQLGVKLIEAGGDLACIGQVDYVTPILDGMNAQAASDPTFADKVTQSAIRVMTLKISMGLAQGD